MKTNFIKYIFVILLIIAGTIEASASIKVVSVQGTVAYKDGQSWTPLKGGMTLNEGAKVSTGVRSNAVIQIEDNIITVQPLTMIKIQRSASTKDSSSTGIGLKRGSLKASVNREKRVKTVFKVTTPIATSSVRGTEKIVSYGPMRGMSIHMITGSAVGENKNGTRRTISGNQVFQQMGNKPGPENILAEAQKLAVTTIFSKNLTEKEENSLQNNGNDQIDNDNSTVNVLTNITGETKGNPTTKVKINVTWP